MKPLSLGMAIVVWIFAVSLSNERAHADAQWAKFRGNRIAWVVAANSGHSGSTPNVVIYDAKGKLVARGSEPSSTPDGPFPTISTATWLPKVTAWYRIVPYTRDGFGKIACNAIELRK